METVKKGRKQGGWAQKFKCTGEGNDGGGCGTTLLVSQIDLYQTSRDSHDETEYFLTFCCHECGVETDVEGVSVEPFGRRPSDRARKAIAKNAKNKKAIRHNNPRTKIKIVLGSASIHKLEAVRNACERLGIEADVSGVKTSSGENEQPVEFEETYRGALTRAQSVRDQNTDAVSIGIESGIFCLNNKMLAPGFDVAVIALVPSNNSSRLIVVTSAGTPLPEDCIKIAEERGFASNTVGSVIAEKFGGDPTDPHSTLTRGKVSRTMILTDALVLALSKI